MSNEENKKDKKLESDSTTEDIVFEETDEARADSQVKFKKLTEELKKCLEEKQAYLDGWQRAKADLINARKRDEEDRKEFVKFANERLIEGLIPILESFDMAMANKEAWEKVDKNWRTGVEYIASQLKKALLDSGLEEINPIGKQFDHNRDEAYEYVPVENESENHKIVVVAQKGYALNGKLLRSPRVKVGEFKKN